MLLHDPGFSQKTLFWLGVHLICIIAPQLSKAPRSEQLTATFNPRSATCFNDCNFILFHQTNMTVVLCCLAGAAIPSQPLTKTKFKTAEQGKYNSANDLSSPKGAQENEVGTERRKPSAEQFSHESFLPYLPASPIYRPLPDEVPKQTEGRAACCYRSYESKEEPSKASLSFLPLKQLLTEKKI